MGRRAELTIRGLHMGASHSDQPMEVRALAEYYQRDGSHYILYEETLEDGGQPVKNRMKFREGRLELTRQGPVSVRMIFEEGQTHYTRYRVPYGELLLGITTRKMAVREQGDRIRLEAEYALQWDGEDQTDSRIEILLSLLPI